VGAPGFLTTAIPLRLASAGSVVALPILAVQNLDDVAVGGALVAASLAPAVVVAPFAGVALDRARRPRRLVVLAALVTVVAFVAGSLLGTLPIWLIAILLVAAGCAAPFYFGGLSSFVTDEIPDERKAYAYDALAYNIASVAGPALVALGGLTGSAGAGMWFMAGAAALGAVGTLALRFEGRGGHTTGWGGTIVAGARHLVVHRSLRLVILAGTIAQFGFGAMPIVAIGLSLERSGDAHNAAVLVTAFAIAGLVGAVASAIRPPVRLAPALIMGGGFAVIGLITLLAIPDLGMPWTVAVIGLSGVLNAHTSAAMLLLRKLNSPPPVRSQVFTIGSGLRSASAALGAAVAGALAGLDAGWLVAAMGALWVIAGATMIGYRASHEIPDEAPEAPAAGPA
jgi:MFS family permease